MRLAEPFKEKGFQPTAEIALASGARRVLARPEQERDRQRGRGAVASQGPPEKRMGAPVTLRA